MLKLINIQPFLVVDLFDLNITVIILCTHNNLNIKLLLILIFS